jgi:putative aldouronate transport system substrate-binding protein
MVFKKARQVLQLAVVIVLGLALVLQGCSGSTGKDSSSTGNANPANSNVKSDSATEQPQPSEPIKITALSYTNAKGPIADDNIIIKEIEKRLNIDLEFQWVPEPQLNERLNVLMASGDLPDITFIKGDQYRKWRDQGAFLDLTSYVNEAPNLMKKIPEHVWKMNDPNGKYFSFPYANPPHREDMLVRKDWLDAAGLKVPTTIDEMADVLEKVVKGDPDKNGKNDTYGFLFNLTPESVKNVTSGMEKSDWIEGGFGLGNGWKEVNGRLVPAFLQPEMKDVLLFLRKQYENGVLSKDFPIAQNTQRLNDFRAGKSVMVYANNRIKSQIDNTVKKVHAEAVTEFIDTPAGPKGLGNTLVVPTSSMFVVPANVKDQAKIKAIVNFMDFLVSDEGYELTKYGTKDKHYTVESDRVWKEVPGAVEDRVGDLTAFFFRPYDPGLNIRKTQDPEYNKIVESLIKKALDKPYANPAWGIYSPLEEKHATKLNNIAKETITKIVMGEEQIEFLEQQQTKWKESGGNEVIAEINKLYKERK